MGCPFGFLLWIALVACAMIAATTSAAEALVLFLVALVLSLLLYSGEWSFGVLAVLLPTWCTFRSSRWSSWR